MTSKDENRLFDLIQGLRSDQTNNHTEVVQRLTALETADQAHVAALEEAKRAHENCPTAKRLDKIEQDKRDNRLIDAIKTGAKTIAAGVMAYLGIKYT